MSGPLTLNSQVVASPDQVSSDLAGETVVLSMSDAQYYGLQGVGTRIWELTQTPATVESICATIVSEYEVDRATAEKDVLSFLSRLAEKGLLEVRSGA